jgi:two-component system, chemotaxis family, chemotaxis protein CheY
MLKKVLVVDDSALIHQMYKMALMRYKCTIVLAKNGQAALDLLPQHPDIDLVLLDINMPIMGGLEFLQKVRALDNYSNIPIVIQTTEGKEEDTKRGLELGAAGYVTKPIQTAALHALIEKLVP